MIASDTLKPKSVQELIDRDGDDFIEAFDCLFSLCREHSDLRLLNSATHLFTLLAIARKRKAQGHVFDDFVPGQLEDRLSFVRRAIREAETDPSLACLTVPMINFFFHRPIV